MRRHEPVRILGPLPMDGLASVIAAAGWTLSPEGGIALCAVADREDVFGTIRPLVQQGLAVVALGPAGDVPCAVSALRAGAWEYLEDDASQEAVVAALERVEARRAKGQESTGQGGGARAEGWLETLLGGQAVGLRTPGTGAFSLAYLREQFRRETWRCHRTGQSFSLAWVTADPTEDPVAFAATVEDVAREVDVVAELGPGEWVVLLPETDRLGAILFRRRLWRCLSRGSGGERMPTSIGVASHPGEGTELDGLIAEAKRDAATFGLSVAERFRGLGFWATVETLLAEGFLVDGTRGNAVFREVWREAARDPARRSLVYLGGEGLPCHGPALPGGTRLHLLGSRATDLPGGVVAAAGDPLMSRHQIALYLAERDAYAFVRRADPAGGPAPAFHTCETALVDHLIGALHDTYDLPP